MAVVAQAADGVAAVAVVAVLGGGGGGAKLEGRGGVDGATAEVEGLQGGAACWKMGKWRTLT